MFGTSEPSLSRGATRAR
ncbi:unnamed protein product, partial [Didymodactylos carnosus]